MSKPVAVVIGATSKWQADGRNTVLAHGGTVADDDVELSARWGVGGAVAQRFAAEGFHVVLTTRAAANAADLEAAIAGTGADASIVELDLASAESITAAFDRIGAEHGAPEVVVYNAGYLDGRDLPPEQELLEHMPDEIFDTAVDVAVRGPFLVAKKVLPSMREAGRGTLLFTNNAASLRGRKRRTGQSLYYPRVLMRTLSQALVEEYSPLGVHVANVVIDGLIDSPGTRALPMVQAKPELLIAPSAIADAYWYLHQQDRSCWTHELQLTPAAGRVSF